MIMDTSLELSTAQAITNSAASEDYIDFGKAGDGYANELFLVVKTKAALTGGTSLKIGVQCHEDSGFSTGTKTLLQSDVILAADLTENKTIFVTRLPKGMEQFCRLYYTVAGTFGAGTVDAFLTADITQV